MKLNSNCIINNKNNTILIDLEEEKSAESRNKEIKNDKKFNENKSEEIVYNFNVFEIVAHTFCSRCLKGNLKLKSELNSKAIELLYTKLDIHAYLRNMFLFDIINQTILDSKKKNIINFLSRPTISIHKEVKQEEIFYQDYEEDDFDKLYEGIVELTHKDNKQEKEKKLIMQCNRSFKDFL